MPIRLDILEDGWIVRYAFERPWTVPELTSLYPQDIAYRRSVNHSVHWLFDLRFSKQLPPPTIFTARFGAPPVLYPETGEVVFAETTPFERTIAETILQIIRWKNAKFFDSRDDAITYLRQRITEAKIAAKGIDPQAMGR